ncbi:DUF1850 domain-containing protein [Thermococcus sp. GR7]|nr:DUF1850 domain-containing protein [Thermococcus sp. GR6]NJE47001.1 DUF1850 domain-containing protein [Thermococcus sp. GR7]NJE78174.1 DUF1850 domain-containing protein [Thermococcus sp. GR4]NJF22709.1 DUF1850 domain-containing protein [Thermococcus sp. GR5]
MISDGVSKSVFLLGDVNVTIKYVHSVQRSEVIEVLKVNRSGIYAEEMRWRDFGAGLPEDIQSTENGYYVKKINIPLGESLDFWFIPLNSAEIWVNGKLVFSPRRETLVEFEVKECSLFEIAIGRC